MSNTPKAVKDYVDSEGVGRMIVHHDPASLLFNGFICVPNHGYDLNESNISVHTINLTEVGKVELMGAPNCTFYQKTDPNQPAYVIGEWYQRTQEYWWAEF
jgi:hypothetical protein